MPVQPLRAPVRRARERRSAYPSGSGHPYLLATLSRTGVRCVMACLDGLAPICKFVPYKPHDMCGFPILVDMNGATNLRIGGKMPANTDSQRDLGYLDAREHIRLYGFIGSQKVTYEGCNLAFAHPDYLAGWTDAYNDAAELYYDVQ